MLQYSPAKIAMVIGVFLIALVYALPNMVPRSMLTAFPSWLKPMSLGLDLRGGSSLLLEVDVSAVAKEMNSDLEETIRAALREPRIAFRGLRTTGGEGFVTITDPAQVATARAAIAKAMATYVVEVEDENRIKITIPEKIVKERQIAAVSQSIEIVRRRVDEFGTAEPSIQRQGVDRIAVELPGVDNPERIKALIGQTAKLNFHLVEPNTGPGTSATDLPPGTMLVPGAAGDAATYVVRRRVEVGGDRLVDSQPTFQNGQPIVSFRFDTAGGRRFGQVTSANVGQRLAILLDNKVISAPVIKSPIVGGSGIIEGGFSVEGARDLALLLRAGALPAPLIVLEERTVGPGLGADSIAQGGAAAIIGTVLVVVFMIIAYHSFGFIAVLGQIFHMLVLFASLSVLGATLTLPGIAGAVLSLGIAVDANVLIYERMREEAQAGRTLLNSLISGFQHAYATIFDSNLTTFVAAALLFTFGSGPVKGFAVTLAIGIMTSMFSAVWVTRLFVWLWYRSGKRVALPI